MKKFPHKAALIAGTCAIAFAALLQSAPAQTPQKQQQSFIEMKAQPVKANASVTLDIKASVTFIQGVEMKVEHEKTETALPEIDTQNAVTRKASITISGLPEETALMTCGVESVAEGAHSRRDCAGSAQVAQHSILGNHSLESGILLTNDLLPNPSGMSESSVSIEVTYL